MAFHLKCMAGELSRALSLVSLVSGKEKQVPILRAIKIEVREHADLTGTNKDHAARVTIAADGNGTVYIEAALITGKAATLRQSQPVEITGDDDGKFVTVSQGRTRWKVPTMDGSGFPDEFASPGDGKAVQLSTGPFFHALSVVRNAINTGSIAFAYDMGCYLDMTDGFRVVALDGKMLALVQIDAHPLPASIVFPTDAMSAMQALFRDAETISVVANENTFSAIGDGIFYKTKLIEMPYPDWRRARDHAGSELDGSAIINIEEFGATIDRAAAITETRTKDGAMLAIKVRLADGEMSFSTSNRGLGEEGSDACEYAGEHSGEFATSGPRLKKMLDTMPGQSVRMTFHQTATDKAIMLHAEPPGPMENYRILMPMRA